MRAGKGVRRGISGLDCQFFGTYDARHWDPGSLTDLNSLITSRADDIITVTQHAVDRAREPEGTHAQRVYKQI